MFTSSVVMDSKITVHLEGDAETKQPARFMLCRFGVQVFTSRPLPHLQPLSLNVEVANGHEQPATWQCTGIAIESVRQEADLYCTFVKFLQVPEQLQSLHCPDHTRSASLCNFCDGDQY
jgi:hypothetical protein